MIFLTSEILYLSNHYQKEIHADNRVVDVLVLSDVLKVKGIFDLIGSQAYLAMLTSVVYTHISITRNMPKLLGVNPLLGIS